jgi:hypothetical protein
VSTVKQISGIIGSSSKEGLEERIKVFDGFGSPAIAVQELLLRERFNSCIWEPAAGEFDIVKILRPKFSVFTSDIHQWDEQLQLKQDFLECSGLPFGQRCDIITNPPFSLAQEFIEKSLELLQFGSKLALLLPLRILEGINRKKAVYDKMPPVRIWVFSYRIPRMHRFGYTGKKSTEMMAFCWIIWQRGNYNNGTRTLWI